MIKERYKVSPTGARIIGTIEHIPGTAAIYGWEADGTPMFAGETDIFWDGQETVCRINEKTGCREAVYEDENHEEWLESELKWDDEYDQETLV